MRGAQGRPVRYAVFTDLDGTLLDHDTYSWEPARPALSRLGRLRIPVVLCSTKTAAEIRPLVRELRLAVPYIVENGGGIRIPRRFPMRRPPRSRLVAGEYALDLGVRYTDLVRRTKNWKPRFPLRGFSGMRAEEVARQCGLSLPEARRAKKREYDEPLILEDAAPDRVRNFMKEVKRLGLRCTRGGRFYHLTGTHDKGTALRLLLKVCRGEWGDAAVLALGDSPVDLPMLRSAAFPIIIPSPSGEPDPRLTRALPQAVVAPFPGPAGWNHAILTWLDSPGIH